MNLCTCKVDPYACPQGQALAQSILDRKTQGESNMSELPEGTYLQRSGTYSQLPVLRGTPIPDGYLVREQLPEGVMESRRYDQEGNLVKTMRRAPGGPWVEVAQKEEK